MKTSGCRPLFWAGLLLLLILPGFFPASAGELLNNEKLVKLLEAAIPFEVIEQKIKISDCQFDSGSEQIIAISAAAQKGSMSKPEISALLKLVMLKSDEEKDKLKNAVDHFMNMAANLDPNNPQEYEAAMRELLRMGVGVVPFLLQRKYIEAESEHKRFGVLDALAQLGEKSETVVRSVRLMLYDRVPAVRRKAAEATAALSNAKCCDELIEELEHPRGEMLDGLCMALGYLRNPKASQPLTAILERSGNLDARVAAAFSLGLLKAKNKQTIEAIRNAILDERSPKLRTAAAKAAAEIGDPYLISYVKKAYERHIEGRAELIVNLKYSKNQETVEFLIGRCAKDDRADVRTAAIHTLKLLSDEDYDGVEDWESWWAIAKHRPDWVQVESVEAPGPGKREK